MKKSSMVRTISTSVALCVAAGLISACGGSDNTDEATDVAQGADPTPVPTPAPTPTPTPTPSPTPTPAPGSDSETGSVACSYSYDVFNSSPSVNMNSVAAWSCSETERLLAANGVPDHAVGEFPNPANPNTITEQSVNASFTLSPVLTDSATELGGPRGETGFVLNGIKIDAGTGGSCDDSGSNCSQGDPTLGVWSIEALGQTSFDFGTDSNNAHVQPGGSYHYHGMPEGFIQSVGGDSTKVTLIGWAADGFPIYARYGYSDPADAGSAIRAMTGSYQLVSEPAANRPDVSLYPLGTFSQDWVYVAGAGDLDECNGRTGVTPEFPGGTYHYYATDTYPFLQRCVKGAVTGGGAMPPGPQ